MKALVKSKDEPGIWMEDIPVPEVGHNDIRIKVTKAAVCGTDLHIFKWDAWARSTIPVGMQIGHEFVGLVDAIGSEVEGLRIGQRVSAEGHITCGHCRNCRAGRRRFCRNTVGVGVNRPGAFAEYVVVPAVNVFPIPDEIPDRIASILDPLGNATHTALSCELVGEDVLITGAGPIGMMATAIARHSGARYIVITDINDYRLEIAAAMGADLAINSRETPLDRAMNELGMTEGFDVGMEMSGSHSALHEMLEAMNHGSSVALLGIPPEEAPMDWNTIIFKGLTLKGIYGRRMFEDWYLMAAMLHTGLDVSPVITHEFHANEYEEAFATMHTGHCAKVTLDWKNV
ncbi:MAG: L-threonine 3-dehydrogenase [Acidimicrobiia bacterium]|nr:L-threonine 3-dehydrogenase [Acidimicrobiia bacterium]